MFRKNRWLVADEPVEFGRCPIEVQDFNLLNILKESIEYISNE